MRQLVDRVIEELIVSLDKLLLGTAFNNFSMHDNVATTTVVDSSCNFLKKYQNSFTNCERFTANRWIDYRRLQIRIAATRTKCTSRCLKAIEPIIGPLGQMLASIDLMDSYAAAS